MIDYKKEPDGIAIISFNMPDTEVNVLNTESISAFEKCIDEAVADKSIIGIIITSGKQDFIVGGDLKMLLSLDDPRVIMKISGRFHAIISG